MAKEICETLEEAKTKWEKIEWGRVENLENKKYNMLTIQYRTINNKDKTYIVVKCDCGNYFKTRIDSVKNDKTVSCGCKKKQQLIEYNKTIRPKDISGKKFGHLTALYPSDKRTGGNINWVCHCDCETSPDREYDLQNLQSGHTQSCGCDNESHGVKKIKEILNDNNIKYILEKTFDSCKFENTNQLARFDFYIENKYLIEYDGEQHFKYRKDQNCHWNNENNFNETQKRDKYKNKWCIENNIPLIRIPYTHLNKLIIDDLKLNTTKFLVTEEESAF